MSLAQAEAFNPSKALYLARPKGYTVLNSSPVAREIAWAGNTYRIPPRDEIVEPHPKFPDDPTVPYSATYADTNEYIPGTVVIRDNGGRDERYGDQSVHRPWMSAEALKGAFGVDEYDNITGILFKQGLTILPENPDRATVLKADQLGKERYKEWRLKNATSVIAAFERANEKRRGNNLSPKPPDKDVLEAQALLNAEDEKFRRVLYSEEKQEAAALDRDLRATATESTPPLPIEIDAATVAEKIAKDPTILMKPEVRAALDETHTLRKRRVPKSQQVRRQLKEKVKKGKRARSDAIHIPED